MINREKSREEWARREEERESLEAQLKVLARMIDEQYGPTVLGKATIH
jgi:hypothetical protein